MAVCGRAHDPTRERDRIGKPAPRSRERTGVSDWRLAEIEAVTCWLRRGTFDLSTLASSAVQTCQSSSIRATLADQSSRMSTHADQIGHFERTRTDVGSGHSTLIHPSAVCSRRHSHSGIQRSCEAGGPLSPTSCRDPPSSRDLAPSVPRSCRSGVWADAERCPPIGM